MSDDSDNTAHGDGADGGLWPLPSGGANACGPGKWLGLGKAHLNAGRLTEAIDALKKSIETDPSNFLGWITLGAALMKSGQNAEGVEALRRAVAADPTQPMAWIALGTALRTQGCLDEAAATLGEAVKLDPADGLASTTLASVLIDSGDRRAAGEVLRSFLSRITAGGDMHDPSVRTAHQMLEELGSAQG